jgi:photosystem II stability/assembly factor-like uncharacterized protein
MPTLYAALDDRVLVVRGNRPDGNPAASDLVGGWHATAHLAGTTLNCFAAAPAAPEHVYAGTVGRGFLRSTDGGESWTEIGEFDDQVTAVTVSPHDPDVVWAGTEPSAIYRSSDGGETWARRRGLRDLPSESRWSYPPRPETDHVRWLSVHPEHPGYLYVAIEAGGFVRTPDAGETWLDHPEDAPRDSHTLATHPGDPDRVYAAAGDGYAESPDGGDSWTFHEAGLDHGYVWGVAVDPGDPETVVVSAADGAHAAHRLPDVESYVYRCSGGDWSQSMAGLPDPVGTVRAELAAGEAGEFYALTNRGLFRSGDAGRSWHRLDLDWPGDRQREGVGLAVVG